MFLGKKEFIVVSLLIIIGCMAYNKNNTHVGYNEYLNDDKIIHTWVNRDAGIIKSLVKSIHVVQTARDIIEADETNKATLHSYKYLLVSRACFIRYTLDTYVSKIEDKSEIDILEDNLRNTIKLIKDIDCMLGSEDDSHQRFNALILDMKLYTNMASECS